jgi:hypothetical protein
LHNALSITSLLPQYGKMHEKYRCEVRQVISVVKTTNMNWL